MSNSSAVKKAKPISLADEKAGSDIEEGESHEIFQAGVRKVDFRTVSWQRAAVIFIKIIFAMIIFAMPAALAALGAVGGGLSVIGWTALNTCMLVLSLMKPLQKAKLTVPCADNAVVLGESRNTHPECHSKAHCNLISIGTNILPSAG